MVEASTGATKDLFNEYRNLKDELKKEIMEERHERENFEKRMSSKFDEVILYFALYVEWARSGAKPPSPYIPEWIYAKIIEARTKRTGDLQDADVIEARTNAADTET